MSNERVENGIVAIDFDPATKEPQFVVIRVNDAVMLTPNAFSAQVLIMTLKRALDCLDKGVGLQASLSDSEITELLRRARKTEKHEWDRIDAIRTEGGEWKIWINSKAMNVYLTITEASQILSDFEGCIEKLGLSDLYGEMSLPVQ